MIRYRSALLLSAGFIACCVASCKKDRELSREEILTNGKWHITANKVTVNIIGMPYTIDRYAIEQPCMQDNLSIFGGDHRLTNDEGPATCAAGDPQQTDGGLWLLSDNDSRLSFAADGGMQNYKINALNTGSMVLQLDSTFLGIATQTLITYEHQN